MADPFPEALSAAALAAKYCSEPEEWERFVTWCRDKRVLRDNEFMSREMMEKASRLIWEVRTEIEMKLLWAKLSADIDEYDS